MTNISKYGGSDECDDCDGSGFYYIDKEPNICICRSETRNIPDETWEALLSLGLNELQAYRAWQIIKGSEDYSEID